MYRPKMIKGYGSSKTSLTLHAVYVKKNSVLKLHTEPDRNSQKTFTVHSSLTEKIHEDQQQFRHHGHRRLTEVVLTSLYSKTL